VDDQQVGADCAEFKRGGGPRSEVHGQIDVLKSDVATVMKGLETLSKFAERGMVK
jgi:hypothetical protein